MRSILVCLLFCVHICRSDVVCYNGRLGSGFQQTYNLKGFKSQLLGYGYFSVKTTVAPEVFGAMTSSHCEPNYRYRLLSRPNDPYYSDLEGILKSIKATGSWRLRGLRKTYVAVVDTGIEWHHPDLGGRVDLELSFNAAGGDSDDFDDQDGHGTHVAGIIGARANNGEGALGISNNVRFIAVRISDDEGKMTLEYIVNAFTYLIYLRDLGVNIRAINASFGGYSYSSILYSLVQELSKRRVILVAAAGNDSVNFDLFPVYPAGYKLPNVVPVGSGFWQSDGSAWISSFSNYGRNVKIIAPGDQVLNTFINHGYESLSGTSMATPFVTGALAVYFGYAPKASHKDAVSDLLSSCTKLAPLEIYANSGCYLNLNNLVKKAKLRASKRR
ncbi:MAG: S8 family serine peptidase [Thermoplasmatales archaeon]